MIVKQPRLPAHDPDRLIDCQEALGAEFQRLVDTAESAGWSGEEVADALLELAVAHVLAHLAKEETEAAIAELRRALH